MQKKKISKKKEEKKKMTIFKTNETISFVCTHNVYPSPRSVLAYSPFVIFARIAIVFIFVSISSFAYVWCTHRVGFASALILHYFFFVIFFYFFFFQNIWNEYKYSTIYVQWLLGLDSLFLFRCNYWNAWIFCRMS